MNRSYLQQVAMIESECDTRKKPHKMFESSLDTNKKGHPLIGNFTKSPLRDRESKIDLK